MKSKILTPLNFGGSKFLLGWIARVKVPPVPSLVALAQRVSELEGKRRKCKSAPCGRTFAPPGRFDPMALKSDQGPYGLKVWDPGDPPFGLQAC